MRNWETAKPADDVLGIAVICGANHEELAKWLPTQEEIPEDFFSWDNPWNRLASTLFFKGGLMPPVKEGINKSHALRHVRACLASMEPGHNHKIAACGYLMSIWYSEPVWVPTPDEPETPPESKKPKFDPNSRNQQKKRARQKRKHRKK